MSVLSKALEDCSEVASAAKVPPPTRFRLGMHRSGLFSCHKRGLGWAGTGFSSRGARPPRGRGEVSGGPEAELS